MKIRFARCRDALCELSLSWKIILICGVSSLLTLSALCSMAFVRDWHTFKLRRESSLAMLAKITASNAEASLRFDDADRAQEYAETFRVENDIQHVMIFDRSRRILAAYSRDEDADSIAYPDFLGAVWDSEGLSHAEDVRSGGVQLGRILIRLDTSSYRESVVQSALVAATLFVGGLGITLLLASRMQRLVTDPIRNLLAVTQCVTRTDDFQRRAEKRYNDEVGALVDAFNEMLCNIETRDATLRGMNAELEQKVEERTEDLRKRNDALEEAMKAAKAASVAKGEFLAMTSHELRTPLNPVIGYVEKMQREDPDGPNARELSLVRQSAEQLLRLIDDILDFSRIENGTISLSEDEVDVAELCESLVSMMEPQARKKDIALSSAFAIVGGRSDENLRAIADEGRLRQVVLNLLSNAIKFTREGSVALRSELEVISETEAVLRIEVEDTGIGISKADRDRLFKPFSQIDGTWTREFGGMGLGLAISHRIVDAMRGSIECVSEPGQGSVFRVELPLRFRAPALPEIDAPLDETLAASRSPAAILLVEDEMVNRELMNALLASLGHEVTLAGNGVEALERIAERAFDFVLLDISMPKMDGFETARRIRAGGGENAGVPIVAMTAHATPEDRDRCFKVGMDDFLSKPISFSKLKATLQLWLARSERS